MTTSATTPDTAARLHPVAAGDPPPDPLPKVVIAEHWGIRPRRSVRLGGDRNVHWRLYTDDLRYVLRCYRADRDEAAIAYEAAVIGHLAPAGWPVAAPIGAPLRHAGRTFALFPTLPGRPGAKTEPAGAQRRRGELLGRLHGDLAGLAIGQRPGWTRVDEFVRASAPSIIEAARRRLADRPALRDVLVEQTAGTAQALADVPADLPVSVLHGDFAPWNLLWRGAELTGLIDFDDVRLDLRAVDVAIARRRDRDGVFSGYRDVAGLSAAEVALLAPLWRGYTLIFVADLLRAGDVNGPVLSALEWCATEMAATRDAGR
jgi:Ser/Thr protein kinase RdoA (MazF antagonist)